MKFFLVGPPTRAYFTQSFVSVGGPLPRGSLRKVPPAEKLYFVMQYMPGGDFDAFLKSIPEGRCPHPCKHCILIFPFVYKFSYRRVFYKFHILFICNFFLLLPVISFFKLKFLFFLNANFAFFLPPLYSLFYLAFIYLKVAISDSNCGSNSSFNQKADSVVNRTHFLPQTPGRGGPAVRRPSVSRGQSTPYGIPLGFERGGGGSVPPHGDAHPTTLYPPPHSPKHPLWRKHPGVPRAVTSPKGCLRQGEGVARGLGAVGCVFFLRGGGCAGAPLPCAPPLCASTAGVLRVATFHKRGAKKMADLSAPSSSSPLHFRRSGLLNCSR